jgi:hypothetical protein
MHQKENKYYKKLIIIIIIKPLSLKKIPSLPPQIDYPIEDFVQGELGKKRDAMIFQLKAKRCFLLKLKKG